jgi:hypothetical protein
VLESPEQLAQGKEIPRNVLVYRIFGPFLFGAAEKMSDALERVDQLPRLDPPAAFGNCHGCNCPQRVGKHYRKIFNTMVQRSF